MSAREELIEDLYGYAEDRLTEDEAAAKVDRAIQEASGTVSTVHTQYVIEYQHAGNDVWYVADFDRKDDLAEAVALAAEFRACRAYPKAAGRERVIKTRIIQAMTINTVVME